MFKVFAREVPPAEAIGWCNPVVAGFRISQYYGTSQVIYQTAGYNTSSQKGAFNSDLDSRAMVFFAPNKKKLKIGLDRNSFHRLRTRQGNISVVRHNYCWGFGGLVMKASSPIVIPIKILAVAASASKDGAQNFTDLVRASARVTPRGYITKSSVMSGYYVLISRMSDVAGYTNTHRKRCYTIPNGETTLGAILALMNGDPEREEETPIESPFPDVN